VEGLPIRDVCGICGKGPRAHREPADRVVLEILTRYGQVDKPATRGDVARLEAKVEALIVALRAGAVGKWS